MDAGTIGALSAPIGSIMFFAMIAAIVIVPRWLRAREREALQATLRAAIEKGQPLPPEMIEAISRDAQSAPSSDRDLRRGVVLLCIAGAFVALAYAGAYWSEDDNDAFGWMLGIAAFPGFIGLASLIMGLIGRGKRNI